MHKSGADRLHDDRISDFCCGGPQILHGGCQPSLRGANPVRFQEAVRLLGAQQRSILRPAPGQDGFGNAAIDRERAKVSFVPVPVSGIPMHRGERPRGALRIRVRGHAMRDELDEARTILGASEEVAQDRLRMFSGDLPDRAGDLHLVDSDRRHVDCDRGVDGSIREDGVHRTAVIVKAPLRGQVDRVLERRLRGSPLLHLRPSRRRQFREPEPLGDQLIDAHDRRAARIRDDCNAVPARDGLQGERHRQVEQLLDRVRP